MAKNLPRTRIYAVDRILGENAKTDADGYITPQVFMLNPHNPVDGYVVSDKDDDASPNYYGYVNADGYWYIMKETVSAGADTYRFAKGTSGYTTNWTNRASLSYDYFYTVF